MNEKNHEDFISSKQYKAIIAQSIKFSNFIESHVNLLYPNGFYDYYLETKDDNPLSFFDRFEIVQCDIIKKYISSTHSWKIKEKGLNSFVCSVCKLYASGWDYSGGIDTHTEVKDNNPSYDFHNNRIRYTCGEIQSFRNLNKSIRGKKCRQCNIFGCLLRNI